MNCPLSVVCSPLSIVPTDKGRHHDDTYQDVYRRHAEQAHKCQRCYPYTPRPPAHLGSLEHIHHGNTYQCHHDGTYALEGLDDVGVILEAGEEDGHQ